MKKIIFIDLDGTLCKSDGGVSEETISIIKRLQEQGHIIVISTGRRLSRIIPLLKKCNIYSYVIALNGAQIYDYNNNQFLLEEDIGFNCCNQIYRLFKRFPSIKISFHTRLLRYTNVPYPEDVLLTDESFKNLEFMNIPQVVIWTNLYSLLEMKSEIERISNIKIVNQSRDLVYRNSSYFENSSFIDISTDNVSKGNAIKFLLTYLHFSRDDAIAIGDSINDLSMFDVVGTKVAMGNADSFLKEKADYITLSNDENGVAYYLEKLLK